MKTRKGKPAMGFSLVEVLVALAVLSIGFAGYAALQLIGIRSVEDSYLRSQATILAEEMAERMRANRAAFGGVVVDQSEYHGRNFAQNPADDFCDGALQGNTIDALRCESDSVAGAAQNCTPTQMAQYDVARVFCGYESTAGVWFGGIQHLSELATIAVTCDAGAVCPAGTAHTIRVTWLAQETDQDDTVDQDGNGDNSLATQFVSVSIIP